MRVAHRPSRDAALCALSLAAALILAGALDARAAAPPVKLTPLSHFGAKVDATTGASVCTVASEDTCQPGVESAAPGGFTFPEGAAIAPASAPSNGNLFVADSANHRVQELTPAGAFVLMVGWEVNATKDGEPGATQAQKNLCTAASGDVCKAGVDGLAASQLGRPQSLALDAAGELYVAEIIISNAGGHLLEGQRVQKFDPATGAFVLEIGKEVNQTAQTNLCTEEEVSKSGVTCGGPALSPAEPETGNEHGAFHFEDFRGGVLAVGGKASEERLYVGDEHRVQEFGADGKWTAEIPLTSISAEPDSKVAALAADRETGDVYLAYNVLLESGGRVENNHTIREFHPNGQVVGEFPVAPRENTATTHIQAIALDPGGRLAVAAEEHAVHSVWFGAFYAPATGREITEFSVPAFEFSFGGFTAVAFDAEGHLYGAASGEHEVESYAPVNVAELAAMPATCVPGPEHETSASFDCTLNGEVNPEGVAQTEAWFQWGRTPALGERTPNQLIAEPEAAHASLPALPPNESFFFRLAGLDANVKPPELLTSDTASFRTPLAPPRILGEPSASFVKAFSAVLFGELNPENANTTYEFRYGACKGLDSPGVASTGVLKASVYGRLGATLEATGLRPGTVYCYRLLASNEQEVNGKHLGGTAKGPEASFTTAAALVPHVAVGPAGPVGATSATITGTAYPEGLVTSYSFELGVYQGAATQYGVVSSASVNAGTAPQAVSLGLTGLQPGVTYAYRIRLAGAGTSATALFTTQALPFMLAPPSVLPLLAVPSIAFPKETVSARPKPLTRAQLLAKALRACKRQAKKKRAACQKQARKKYPKSKQANNRKKG
jgi:hypothetical protein